MEQFMNYIKENFDVDGATIRLIDNILSFVQSNYCNKGEQYRILSNLLDNTIGLTDDEIREAVGFHLRFQEIDCGAGNAPYLLVQSDDNNYLISKERVAECKTEAELKKTLSDIVEDFATHKFIVMGYDKDTDTQFQMGAADNQQDAILLARKIWEKDCQRTDINRESRNAPDLDWFELYEQTNGNIDYSKPLGTFNNYTTYLCCVDDLQHYGKSPNKPSKQIERD